jgi:hypothetical protein
MVNQTLTELNMSKICLLVVQYLAFESKLMMIAGNHEMDDDNASKAIAEALKTDQVLRILKIEEDHRLIT